MTTSQEAREYPPLPPMDIQEVACEYGEVPEPDAPMLDVGYSADAMRSYVDADRKARQQEALTDAQIAAGWESTFSTRNPFCPCDLRSFTKAVRWAEHAIRAAIAKGEQSHE